MAKQYSDKDSQQLKSKLGQYLELVKRCRQVASLKELAFTACNLTREIISYERAVYWNYNKLGQIDIVAISSVAVIDQHSAELIWFKSAIKQAVKSSKCQEILPLDSLIHDELKQENKTHSKFLWIPFIDHSQQLIGGMILTHKEDYKAPELIIIKELAGLYGYHGSLLSEHTNRSTSTRLKAIRHHRYFWWGVGLILLLFLVPVRQSALAPGEVVAQDPTIIASQLNGVIEQIYVEPYQTIKKKSLLFSLDPVELENRFSVAKQNLAIAREKYRKASQQAFQQKENSGDSDIRALSIEIKKAKQELSYTQALLERLKVYSPDAGTIIFTDKNEWLGKPVKIGEKVMTLADRNDRELEIWLPVTEVTEFKPGNDVKLFLNTQPLSPLYAKVESINYLGKESPEGVLAYRVYAKFQPEQEIPTIGLRGRAKLYSQRVPFIYYLLRRPIIATRKFLGV